MKSHKMWLLVLLFSRTHSGLVSAAAASCSSPASSSLSNWPSITEGWTQRTSLKSESKPSSLSSWVFFWCKSKPNSLIIFFPFLCPLFLFTDTDSPRIFSLCCIRSLQLLLPMACCTLTSIIHALSHLLPHTYSLFGTGLFSFESLELFHSFFWNHELGILALNMDFPITARALFLSDASVALCGSLHPCHFHRSLPLFHLPLPSFFSCSMANTGNHGEQVCDIHGNLAIRYEPRGAKSDLHAGVLIGGGIFGVLSA